MKYQNTGTSGPGAIKYFDIDKREEKTILENANGYLLSDNKGKILAVRPNNQFAIIQPAENQKFEKPLRVAEMQTMVDPAAEWKQIFADAWRIERDYFYDPGMHGVNWNQVKERYVKMLEGAMTREEANFVIGEMIGELNASHTYLSGGDLERPKTQNTGYLGVD